MQRLMCTNRVYSGVFSPLNMLNHLSIGLDIIGKRPVFKLPLVDWQSDS